MEEKNATIKIYLSQGMRAKFKSACALENTSMNEVLLGLIAQWLEEREDLPNKSKEAS